MTKEEMTQILENISARLDVIYSAEKHWAKRWTKGEIGMTLYPPATPAQINALENRLGKKLPPSSRQFLSITDGCNHFWEDFRFLGATGDHNARVAKEIEEHIEWQKGKIKERFGAVTNQTIDSWEAERPQNLFLARHLPFAATFGGEVYVFDLRTQKPNGEAEVIFWDLSWGAWEDRRDANFDAMLERTLKEVDERAKKYKSKAKTKPASKAVPAKKTKAKKSPKKVSAKRLK